MASTIVSPGNDSKEDQSSKLKLSWPAMGSSIMSLSVNSDCNNVALDSSSIFSMDHLQEVLVEKQDALEGSTTYEDKGTTIEEQVDTKSVVSSEGDGEEDNGSVASDNNNGGNINSGSSSLVAPVVKPFWYKAFLSRSSEDKEVEEEANDETTATEEKEEPLLEDEPNMSDQDVDLEEVLVENSTSNNPEFLETLRRLFSQEKLTAAVEFCKDQWEKARCLVEPSLEKPEFFANCCVLGFLVVLGGLVIFCANVKSPHSTPKSDLKAFVLYEKAKMMINIEDIEELETDVFNAFARSACVKAGTANATRDALFSDLRGIPDNVRVDVVEMAVKEGVTQLSSLQDSKADIVDKGKAYSFMAFWSTAYNPKKKHETYETCVMVTGVVLTVAETVAEWTLKQEKYQIGVQPCFCGPLSCAECPIFDTRVVKWPILERRSLSLKKQKELRRWMVDEAIQSAEHLIASSGPSVPLIGEGGQDGKEKFGWNPMANLAWSNPSKVEFLGGPSASNGESANGERSEL